MRWLQQAGSVLGYDENDNQIINLKSGYDPVHPFEGRDPRFYVSILYHGAQWQEERLMYLQLD